MYLGEYKLMEYGLLCLMFMYTIITILNFGKYRCRRTSFTHKQMFDCDCSNALHALIPICDWLIQCPKIIQPIYFAKCQNVSGTCFKIPQKTPPSVCWQLPSD